MKTLNSISSIVEDDNIDNNNKYKKDAKHLIALKTSLKDEKLIKKRFFDFARKSNVKYSLLGNGRFNVYNCTTFVENLLQTNNISVKSIEPYYLMDNIVSKYKNKVEQENYLSYGQDIK